MPQRFSRPIRTDVKLISEDVARAQLIAKEKGETLSIVCQRGIKQYNARNRAVLGKLKYGEVPHKLQITTGIDPQLRRQRSPALKKQFS